MVQSLSRRQFIRALGIAGLAIGAGIGPAASVLAAPRAGKHTRTALMMGTYVSITVVHESAGFADDAAGKAFDAIRADLPCFDMHDSASAISVLNRDGTLSSPPPQLVSLMEAAGQWNRVSSGAFDPSVTPLVALFRDAVKSGTPPTQAQLTRTLERVHGDRIVVSGNAIRLEPDMAVTLNGIAKGALVDRASEVLSDMGAETHLINAGGDIRAAAAKGLRPWRIAVQSPTGGDYPAVLAITNGAVASSGSYESARPEAGGFSHLLDPRTGQPGKALAGVTVQARTAADADALSTAAYVLGARDGLRLVNATPSTECVLIGNDGSTMRSSGFNGVAI